MKKLKLTTQIALSAMFASLICVLTMVTQLPILQRGYINFGDTFVFVGAYVLGGFPAILAAGIGSCLADIFSGYIVYAPITFIAKGLEATVCVLLFKAAAKKERFIFTLLICILSGIVMAGVYFVYETILYGIVISLATVLFNVLQGVACSIVGVLIIQALKRYIKKENVIE